jgi:hypothetical protein
LSISITFPVLLQESEDTGHCYAEEGDASRRYKLGNVPTDRFYTVQTFEGDVNRKLDDMYKEKLDKYYKEKRPIS